MRVRISRGVAGSELSTKDEALRRGKERWVTNFRTRLDSNKEVNGNS